MLFALLKNKCIGNHMKLVLHLNMKIFKSFTIYYTNVGKMDKIGALGTI